MASGAKRATQYIREQTVGVTPSTGQWSSLLRTSFGVAPTYETSESDEISGDRMSQGTSPDAATVGGEVGQILHYGMQDEFMASCFGAEWENDVLTMGDEKITFSMAVDDPTIDVYGLAKGCQVGALTITMNNTGDIVFTPTFSGTGWQDQGTSSFVPEADRGQKPISKRMKFFDVKNIAIDGEVLQGKACVDNMSITFENNLDSMRCLGSGNAFPSENSATVFEPTGQMVLKWTKTAFDIWKGQRSGDRHSLSFSIGNSEGEYQFELPVVEFAGDYPDAGAQDTIMATFNMAAAITPPTITRVAGTAPVQTANDQTVTTSDDETVTTA